MIHSTSSSNGTLRTDALAAGATKSPFRRAGADHLSLNQSATVQGALVSQPEIRPEVVELGRALAADPSYPSLDIMRQVSEIIVRSPDLTADVG